MCLISLPFARLPLLLHHQLHKTPPSQFSREHPIPRTNIIRKDDPRYYLPLLAIPRATLSPHGRLDLRANASHCSIPDPTFATAAASRRRSHFFEASRKFNHTLFSSPRTELLTLRFCVERESRKRKALSMHTLSLPTLCRRLIGVRRGCPGSIFRTYLGAASAGRFSSPSRRPLRYLPRTDALKPLGTVGHLAAERAVHHRKCAVLQTEEKRNLSTNGKSQSRNVLHMQKQTKASDISLCGWLNGGHRNKDLGWRG